MANWAIQRLKNKKSLKCKFSHFLRLSHCLSHFFSSTPPNSLSQLPTLKIKGLFGELVWIVLFECFWFTRGWKSVWKCVLCCLKCVILCLSRAAKQAPSLLFSLFYPYTDFPSQFAHPHLSLSRFSFSLPLSELCLQKPNQDRSLCSQNFITMAWPKI